MSDNPYTLEFKVFGRLQQSFVATLEDAVAQAIYLINSGAGIPKGIYREGKLVLGEATINRCWEGSLQESPNVPDPTRVHLDGPENQGELLRQSSG